MIIPLVVVVVVVAAVVVVPVFLSPSEPVVLSLSRHQPPFFVCPAPSFSLLLASLTLHSFSLSKGRDHSDLKFSDR